MSTDTETEFSSFGWCGISCAVPSEWELGKETGTRQEGYCRLDGLYYPRLEVTWKKPGKSYKLSKIAENYKRNLKKKLDGEDACVQELYNFCDTPEDKETLIFKWGQKNKIYEMISFCRQCYRLVFLRYITEEDDRVVQKARQLYSSFQDHPVDGYEQWSFLGFNFKVPRHFSLDNEVLNAGFIRMDFSYKDDLISTLMLSMGDDILKKGSLDEMVCFYMKKDFKKFKGLDFEEISVNGHEGVCGVGVRKEHRKIMRRFFPEQGFLKIYGWYCPDSNKIFMYKAYSKNSETLEEISGAYKFIQCHSDY